MGVTVIYLTQNAPFLICYDVLRLKQPTPTRDHFLHARLNLNSYFENDKK